MDIVLTRRLIVAGGVGVAAFAGWQIAEGRHALAGFTIAAIALLAANRLIGAVPDALVAGAVMVGYLVGNRGFAQLSMPNLPLLPGELALGLGFVCLLWRSARGQRLPWRRDGLNYAVLFWFALGAVRLPFDFRNHGFVAVRDFAMVYYALFFFLAQAWAEGAKSLKWLNQCLTVGFALTVPTMAAFRLFPDFFINRLVVGNAPLIYVKSDVAGGFIVGGAFWFLHCYTQRRQAWWLGLVVLNLAGAVYSNSRAALVSVAFCVLWVLALRIGSWLRVLGAIAAVGLLALTLEAAWPHSPGNPSQLYRIYESVATIADIGGERVIVDATLGDKPDNNRFRTVWWGEVIRETREGGPWLGLGFGHDLAARFGEIYFPEGGEDFTARSPHNFLLTVLARMGGVGFAPLAAVLFFAARGTWRSSRQSPTRTPHPGWLAAWSILVSACFGVVLEGPMGAIVFWSVLGMANAAATAREEETEAPAEELLEPTEAAVAR